MFIQFYLRNLEKLPIAAIPLIILLRPTLTMYLRLT